MAQAIRFNYPEKKGYSVRNLSYMCQFAKAYPLNVLRKLIETETKPTVTSIQNITDSVQELNNTVFTPEPLAQIPDVTRYLPEMGNGFAFVARQKHFQIGDSDFFADLILYNIKLHAYVVVELKATPFKPEYAGQLNFYINVADDKLRGESDNKTIGLLLCRGKDEVVAQYALAGYDQPIGISDYQLSKAVPENLKSALPSIEEVEEELTLFLDKDKNP